MPGTEQKHKVKEGTPQAQYLWTIKAMVNEKKAVLKYHAHLATSHYQKLCYCTKPIGQQAVEAER
jgi:hypothetical protein